MCLFRTKCRTIKREREKLPANHSHTKIKKQTIADSTKRKLTATQKLTKNKNLEQTAQKPHKTFRVSTVT